MSRRPSGLTRCVVRRSLLLAVALPVLHPGAATGQASTDGPSVRGRVIDAVTRLPVEGATARIEGSTTSALSNGSGLFAVRVPAGAGSAALRIARIGYLDRTVEVAADGWDRLTTIELTPQAIRLEGLDVVVDEFWHRFERRRNSSPGVVRVIETQELLDLGAREGFHAFWKVVRLARPCRSRGSDYCISLWGRDVPVVLCIDDRRAHAGVVELERYRPEDFFLWEIYDHGTVIRTYTNAWVRSGMARRALPPAEWGC